jgi:4-amino-4-deoxy-L-arabinose transferase-like glycosyltransferase
LSDSPEASTGRPDRTRATPVLWIALYGLALVGLSWGSASTALMDPDEGRNAEVAREMAESGDFVVPHLNGLPYLDKPILFFALAAASIRVLGVSELAARMPSLLFCIATAAMIAAFGWHRFGRATGTLAGLALLTSPLVLGFGHVVIFDAAMMFWVSAACMACFLAWEQERTTWWVVAWAAAGFGVLTKGPVGLVLPLLVALAYGLVCGRPLRRIFHPIGIAVFVGIVAPWFLAVTARHPEFPHYAFVRETFERVATDRMNRTAPFWYFVPLLVGGALPWVLLPLTAPGGLAAAWRERREAGRDLVFLLLWIALPLLFFSISQSKRPGYILPVFPAIALLAAWSFETSAGSRRRVAKLAGSFAALLGVVLLLGSDSIAGFVKGAGIIDALRGDGPRVGLFLLASAGLLAMGVRSKTALRAGLAVVVPLLIIGGGGILAEMGEHKSARDLARAIQAEAPPQARIVGIGTFPSSLPFYLGAPILLATATGAEFRSNYIADYVDAMREKPGSTLRPYDWWQDDARRCPEPTVYITKPRRTQTREVLAEHMPLLVETSRYAAYGPCQPGDA